MDDFRFGIPLDDIDVEKADDGGEVERRVIYGYASTAARDGDAERVIQDGLDLSYLKSFGFINYDHLRHILLGWPLDAIVDAKGLRFKGQMIPGLPMADLMWNTACALKKARAPRRLGLSIEGKILERTGNTIKKARVFNVAVTPHPVNPLATFDVLLKAMQPCSACPRSECVNCKEALCQALTAGTGTALEDQTDGDALRVESLDHKLKVMPPHPDRSERPSKRFCRRLKGKAREICERMAAEKSLDFDDAVTFLQLTTGLPVEAAFTLAEKLTCKEVT